MPWAATACASAALPSEPVNGIANNWLGPGLCLAPPASRSANLSLHPRLRPEVSRLHGLALFGKRIVACRLAVQGHGTQKIARFATEDGPRTGLPHLETRCQEDSSGSGKRLENLDSVSGGVGEINRDSHMPIRLSWPLPPNAARGLVAWLPWRWRVPLDLRRRI